MHCLTYVHLDLLRTQYSLAVMITLPNTLAVITLALPSGSVTKRKSQRHGQGSRSPPVPPVSANRFPQPQETSSPSLKIPSKSSQAKDPKQKLPIEISKTKRNIIDNIKRKIPNESSQTKDPKRKFPVILVWDGVGSGGVSASVQWSQLCQVIPIGFGCRAAKPVGITC